MLTIPFIPFDVKPRPESVTALIAQVIAFDRAIFDKNPSVKSEFYDV